jgi:hypothetical protein
MTSRPVPPVSDSTAVDSVARDLDSPGSGLLVIIKDVFDYSQALLRHRFFTRYDDRRMP